MAEDRNPHTLRRPKNDAAYPEAWYYNDEKGITVVVGGKLARLPWSVIEKAAKRVGRPASRSSTGETPNG